MQEKIPNVSFIPLDSVVQYVLDFFKKNKPTNYTEYCLWRILTKVKKLLF